jgi:hypothetical protein
MVNWAKNNIPPKMQFKNMVDFNINTKSRLKSFESVIGVKAD